MHFPINLNIVGKPCVVVGGGEVALRKVLALLECGGVVTVISPEYVTGIAELAEQQLVSLLVRHYRTGDIAGAYLVFAATNNTEVQELVAREARERAILLNSADDPKRCDFQIPARVRRGTLLLTAATGGASPALSRRIRLELEQVFGEEYGQVTAIFGLLREKVVTRQGDSPENRKLFEALLDAGIVQSIRNHQWVEVAAILEQYLPSGIDIAEILPGSSGVAPESTDMENG